MKAGSDIKHAATLLRSGKVVAIPTETVYGLAANAFNAEAVINIFEIKNRPKFNPLIVHVQSWEMVEKITTTIDPLLKKIAEKFWPGPLTILFPKSDQIHPIITAGSAYVAVRMPNHPLTIQLLTELDFPLAAPSANLFGKISPTTAAHVLEQLGDQIEYVLDGGECSVGVESTIIKMNMYEKVEILRPGGVSAEEIAEITGYLPKTISGSETPEAPGMLNSHYAPKMPLVLGNIEELLKRFADKKIAVLSYYKKFEHPAIVKNYQLSPKKELHEAAHNLFSLMHEAENSGADLIISELLPDEGIGRAINDRLKRASF